VLKGAIASAAAGVWALTGCDSGCTGAAESPPAGGRPWPVVDVNVNLFAWPFRRLPHDTPARLIEKLRGLAVAQAWASSNEAILHRDLAGVNARLAEACAAAPRGLLVPFGSVNPTLPDWRNDLRRCHETHRMPGLRLLPGYHRYTLDDPQFVELLDAAARRGLLVQLAVSLEDVRTQHAGLQTADVDLRPLADALAKTPDVRIVLLNYKPSRGVPSDLARSGRVWFDTARVEGTDGIERLMAAVSPERVVLGSHAPFFVAESALIKVYESALDERHIRLLLAENARGLVAVA